LPAHNARFAVVPAGEGLGLHPRSRRVRPHFVKARIKVRPVHVYPDGTPSFTGRAASAATTRTERSEMRKSPLKSARRRNPVDGMDKPLARLPRPQANKAEETDIRCATKNGQLNSLSTGDTLKSLSGRAHSLERLLAAGGSRRSLTTSDRLVRRPRAVRLIVRRRQSLQMGLASLARVGADAMRRRLRP
jgi:hypothetical protein